MLVGLGFGSVRQQFSDAGVAVFLTGVVSIGVHLCRHLAYSMAEFRWHRWFDQSCYIIHRSCCQLFPGHNCRPRYCKAILYVYTLVTVAHK